ncbi:MAG: hypothetical protein ACKO4Q_13500, partial [Planctomycetota bacterium]
MVLTREARVSKTPHRFSGAPERRSDGRSRPMTTGCVVDRLDALRRLRAAVVPPALPMDLARLIDAVAPCVRAVRIDRMHAVERARPLRARASG